jgi:hypothetical protein
MSEKLKFFKGIEADLPSSLIPGAIYHCTDTGNTYLATSATTKTLFSTNDIDTNTTYTLSGKIDTGAYKLTLTDSGNKTSTASVPAMGGATSTAPSTPGLVPIATSANRTKYLRGDGTWVTPTDTHLRVYRQTSGYDADYPILVSRTKTADIATVGEDNSYESVYAVIG